MSCGLLIFLQKQRKNHFLLFPNFRKEGKFAVSIERLKAKVFQLQGGFIP